MTSSVVVMANLRARHEGEIDGSTSRTPDERDGEEGGLYGADEGAKWAAGYGVTGYRVLFGRYTLPNTLLDY
jgi:hypothetical protein